LTGPTDALYSVGISPNGQQVVAAGLDRKIYVWNIDNPTPLKTLSGHKDDIYKVEFSANGNRLLSVGYSGTVSVWDPNQEKPLFSQKLPAILYSGTFSPNGKQVTLLSNDSKVYLLDLPVEAQ
jgi:WD40 repeat protein